MFLQASVYRDFITFMIQCAGKIRTAPLPGVESVHQTACGHRGPAKRRRTHQEALLERGGNQKGAGGPAANSNREKWA